MHGVALGLFAEDASWSYRPLLAEIVAAGADHVALVVPLYQTDGAADDIVDTRASRRRPRRSSPPSATPARDGLEVTLFPIVRLSAPRTPGEWRGTLAPRDRAAWFAQLRRSLVELAGVAATSA